MSRFNVGGGISNEELREAAEYVRDNDGVDYDGCQDTWDEKFITASKLIAAAMLARLDGKEDFYDGGSP
jgi:hypothetical protein